MKIALHAGQLSINQDPHKIRTVCCGRRWGKTRLGIAELILAALGFQGTVDPLTPERVLGILPTYAMAKTLLWEPLFNIFTETELKGLVKGAPNKSEMRIDLIGKPTIMITSAEGGGDRIRGKRIYFALCDEAQDFHPEFWDKVLLPATADTLGSRVLNTGTPKGKTNILYELLDRAGRDPATYAAHIMPTSANPFVPRAEIERARLILPPKVFRQEFEASMESFDGQIYSELDDGNRCDSVPEGLDLTILGVDWGDVHPCVVALGRLDQCWYFLEGWQGNLGATIADGIFAQHIRRLAAKYNIKATYCDPSRPAAILSVRQLGHPGLERAVAGYNRINDGIYQVHSYIYRKALKFPRWVYRGKDPGAIDGNLAFDYAQSYHYEKDRDGNVVERPADGIESHINDALRYAIASEKGLLF